MTIPDASGARGANSDGSPRVVPSGLAQDDFRENRLRPPPARIARRPMTETSMLPPAKSPSTAKRAPITMRIALATFAYMTVIIALGWVFGMRHETDTRHRQMPPSGMGEVPRRMAWRPAFGGSPVKTGILARV